MPLYSYAGLTLASVLALAELALAGEGQAATAPDFTFRLLAAPPPEPADGDWLRPLRAGSHVPFAILARQEKGFLLRFPRLADFVLSEDGGQIAAWPTPSTDEYALRHLLLDQVLPRLLGHQGRLVLHASVVDLGGRAIAFGGLSGRGKSTLAASLHMAGFPLLTDDGVLVTAGTTHAIALAIYPGLRLWQASVAALYAQTPAQVPVAQNSDKQRILLPAAAASTPLPLAALYLLAAPRPDGDSEAITISPLSSRDACIALISHSFQLHAGDRGHAARLLLSASAVAAQLPVFDLAYPRDFSRLQAVHQAIVQQHIEWAAVA